MSMSITPPPKINLVMVVVSSQHASLVRLGKLLLPVAREDLLDSFFRQEWLLQFLTHLDVPQNFFNGRDCDMVNNLSNMLYNSVMQPRGVETDHNITVVVMVFKAHCSYNVVNIPIHADDDDDRGPSREEMIELACGEGCNFSLPAGTSTLGKFTVQEEDKDGDCAICLKEFITGDEVAKMPCSHVYHYNCILKWFVQKGTCPVCRFICNHESF